MSRSKNMKMQSKRLVPAEKFNLLIVFWLSLSLATPVIHGLGYTVPDFLGRALFTALAVLLCAVTHKLPLLTLSAAAFLAAAAALGYRLAPHFLIKLGHLLLAPRSPDAYLWPLAVIGAVSLLLYLIISKIKNRLPLLLIIGLGSFAPLWYLFVDSAYPAAVSYTAGWFMLLSYQNGAALWGKRAAQTKQPQEELADLRRSWIRYTLLFLFLAIFLALLLPKGFPPVHWAALHNWAHRAFPFVAELRGSEDDEEVIRGDGEEFDFYSTGLQETERLDGPLRQDPTILLEVRGRGGLYLRGTVYDRYTGRSWLNTSDTAGTAAWQAPPAALFPYLEEVEIGIRHRRLRTRTVFNILYPVEITGLPVSPRFDGNSGITLSHSLSLRQEYGIKGFVQAYRADIASLERKETPREMEAFLELPGEFPSRVLELALEITAGRQGNYAKMKALEAYLRLGFSYNNEMPLLHGGIDFVDFFLFESGEGYCTYFASALAVLGRAAGVPTRYVAGFVVPDRSSGGGIFEVAGTDAHAWVEAYIPGLGWLAFEPTPGFNTDDSLPLTGDTPGHVGSAPGEYDAPPPVPGTGELPDPGNGHLSPFIPRDSEKAAHFHLYLRKALVAAALAIPVFIGIKMLRRYRRIKRSLGKLAGKNNRLRAACYYNLTLSLLQRLEAGKHPGETPREYSSRIIHEVYKWDLNFREISEGINLALYGRGEELPAGLAEETEQFFHFIFKRYLSRVGKTTACFEILLQGKIF